MDVDAATIKKGHLRVFVVGMSVLSWGIPYGLWGCIAGVELTCGGKSYDSISYGGLVLLV